MLDQKLVFSEDQAVTATAASTNVLDLKLDNMGDGNALSIFSIVTTAFAGGTSMSVALQHSDFEGSGYTDLISGPVVLLADLVAGYKAQLGTIPKASKRYLRINYTVSGTMTAGAITTAIELDSV